MRVIFNIARAELRYFFYSPVAWFILILFLMTSSGIILSSLSNFAIQQENLIELEGDKFEGFVGKPLTSGIISQSFDTILMIFFLFIPLLTMGVINREHGGGTMRLLHTSPVKVHQVVLGKFIGVYAFVCTMILLFSMILVVLGFSIKHVEIPHMLAMLLGFFLLAGMYVAVGMFISSLTVYPIVAAIGIFVVLLLFTMFGLLFQEYDYIRDVTYFLSSAGKAQNMLAGLITTKDLVYFCCITGLFILFTIYKMKSDIESGSWKVSARRYLSASIVVIVILVATSIHGFIGYWDVTRRQTNTLHPNTQEMIKKLDGTPLKVTLYTNLFGYNLFLGLPKERNKYLWDFWAKTRRFYPNMEFDYVYYYDLKNEDSTVYKAYPGKTIEEIAEKFAEIFHADLSQFKKPEEIRSLIDLQQEDMGLIMQMEYKGKKAFLRTYPVGEPWPLEIQISGTLARIINDTTPVFKFLTGHYERSPFKTGSREFGGHATVKSNPDALINLGLDVDTISEPRFESFTDNEILVIADPRTMLDQAIIDRAKEYIDRGGNILLYAEPGKQAVMNPILNHMGVHADEGTLVWTNPQDMPHKFAGSITDGGNLLADELWLYYRRLGIIDTCRTGIMGASNLSVFDSTHFKIEPIVTLNNNENTWIERGILVVDSAAPVFDDREGDYRLNVPYQVGLKLNRTINNKEQRIIIISDADMMSQAQANGANFGNAFYSFAVNNELPVYHNLELPKDIWLTIKKAPAQWLLTFFKYIVPGFILILGAVILIRRKRK